MTPDREAAAGLVAKLQARRERYSNHRGNYLMYSTFDAILDQEVAVALEAAEARALKAEKELEQRERVIAGLNRQLTEQFELSTKYVGNATKAEALVAEAVRVCEPFAKEAGEYGGAYQDDFWVRLKDGVFANYTVGDLRAARAFIDRAKESGT